MESTLIIVYLSGENEHLSIVKHIDTALQMADRLMSARDLIRDMAQKSAVISAVLRETGLESAAGTPTASVTKVFQPKEWGEKS